MLFTQVCIVGDASILQGNEVTPKVKEKLHESEARVKVLTEEWAERWGETASILQDQKDLALRKEGRGVVLDSELPHLIGIDDDLLSTGILLYHLKVSCASAEDVLMFGFLFRRG